MTFKEAKMACKKVGTNNAKGDALRAMYAQLIADTHCGFGSDGSRFYSHLLTASDTEIANEARKLLRDRATAYDVLLGIKP